MNKQIEKTPSDESVSIIVPENDKPVNQIDSWIEMRKDFTQKVVSIMVEGKDYHKIKFGGKEVQVLAKGGAEKVASALGWKAEFIKDSETYEMLGNPVGVLCYICNLKNGEFIGQGRGARSIKQDSGDINKAIKMAQKSAFIDAILRGSGLSDLFTQDLEQNEEESKNNLNFPPSEKQLEVISKNMLEKNVTEADLMDEGFPALKDLTGGKDGTASEVIGYLFKISNFSNGIKPPTDEDRMVSQFIRDLEECTTVAMYQKVANEIKLAKDMGHLTGSYYQQVLKVALVIAKKIQDSIYNTVLETKPFSKAAELMQKGINKTK